MVIMDSTTPRILRPLPQRPFSLSPAASAESSQATTPLLEAKSNSNSTATDTSTPSDLSLLPSGQTHTLTPTSTLQPAESSDMTGSSPSRTRSILNLTSSTLFGIYSPTGNDSNNVNPSEPSTPWGTGAETPARGMSFDGSRPSQSQPFPSPRNGKFTEPRNASSLSRPQHRRRNSAHLHRRARGFRGYVLPMMSRTVALFAAGVMYGILIRHLHENPHIAPVKVEGVDRNGWLYGGLWGMAGVALGWGLPWVDTLFYGEENDDENEGLNMVGEKRGEMEGRNIADVRIRGRGEGWEQVVRSVGAFVGIAFAIRRLPWQSTLQVSLTLALVNPVIWYLLDRTKPGFVLSTLVGIFGSAGFLLVNPALVPPPTTSARISTNNGTLGIVAQEWSSSGWAHGLVTYEMVGEATWIASVLFCSCVCFGNIGRRLALGRRR